MAAPDFAAPAGRLASRSVCLPPRLCGRGGELSRPGGFTALVEAPWWATAGAAMALVTATLLCAPATIRLVGDLIVGASAFALLLSWGLDPATTDITGTPLWGCLLFCVGVSLIDAGHNLQERRASRPPQGENGA